MITQHVRIMLTHFQTLLTDLPCVQHVRRLLSQKVRNKFLKNQSEKIYRCSLSKRQVFITIF